MEMCSFWGMFLFLVGFCCGNLQKSSKFKSVVHQRNLEALKEEYFKVFNLKELKKTIKRVKSSPAYDDICAGMILEQKKSIEIDRMQPLEDPFVGKETKIHSYHFPHCFPFFKGFLRFLDCIEMERECQIAPEKVKLQYFEWPQSYLQIVEQLNAKMFTLIKRIPEANIKKDKLWKFFLISVGKYPCFLDISRRIYQKYFSLSHLSASLPYLKKYTSFENFKFFFKEKSLEDMKKIKWHPNWEIDSQIIPRETLMILIKEFGIEPGIESCFHLLSMRNIFMNRKDDLVVQFLQQRLGEFSGMKFSTNEDYAFSSRLSDDMRAYLAGLGIEIKDNFVSASKMNEICFSRGLTSVNCDLEEENYIHRHSSRSSSLLSLARKVHSTFSSLRNLSRSKSKKSSSSYVQM